MLLLSAAQVIPPPPQGNGVVPPRFRIPSQATACCVTLCSGYPLCAYPVVQLIPLGSPCQFPGMSGHVLDRPRNDSELVDLGRLVIPTENVCDYDQVIHAARYRLCLSCQSQV